MKKFHLSANNYIGGVCGGIAEYFKIDATFVRIAFLCLVLFCGIGVVPYLLIWLIAPKN